MREFVDVSDGVLVERARLGDRSAEEQLYRRHVKSVTGLVLRMLRQKADAEDVVQEAFLDAFSDLPKLAEPDLFARWLLKIAIHRVHRRFRRRALLRWVGLDAKEDIALDEFASADMSVEDQSELRRIGALLHSLAPEEQSAWLLKHVEGYSMPEVAALSKCSLSTAKRRVEAAEVRIDSHVRGVR